MNEEYKCLFCDDVVVVIIEHGVVECDCCDAIYFTFVGNDCLYYQEGTSFNDPKGK